MDFNINQKLREALKKVLSISNKDATTVVKKIAEDLKKVRLLAAVRFLNYTYKIKENAYTFRLLGSLFVLESLIASKKRDKLRKVQKLLRDNLLLKDKLSLLGGFTFSKKYEFRKDLIFPLRHIMFKDFDKDVNFKRKEGITKVDYCSGSNPPLCYCVDWLRKNQNKINDYLVTLVKYLYEMRHAVVHESFPVLGLPDYSEKYGVGSFSSSLLDAYPVSEDKKYFRSYEAYIDPDWFFKIIRSCVLIYRS